MLPTRPRHYDRPTYVVLYVWAYRGNVMQMKLELKLGNIGEDGCPCGEVVEEGYKITTHCWKSGACRKHPYSCVHVSYTKGHKTKAIKHAKQIRRYIAKAWMTQCDYD